MADLSVSQAALLAGLIRAPSTLDPRVAPDAATTRRNQVVAAMASMGSISTETATEAMAQPLGVLPSRPAAVTDPFAVEAVKREFLANPAFGETEADRRRLLLTGGLEIHTTVDPHLQAAARTALDQVDGDLGSALVAVDPRTGAVLAIHDAGQAAGSQFDVATQGRRAPGSTFKPLAAAAALEAGMPQDQFLVGDGPIELDYGGAPEPWRVDNFEGAEYGPVVLADAVVDSVNTAFAQVGVAVGPERIADVAGRLGIDVERAMGPPAARGPAIALGGLRNGVSPLELASAYAAFAADGTYTRPHLIAQVVGPDGKELFRAAARLPPGARRRGQRHPGRHAPGRGGRGHGGGGGPPGMGAPRQDRHQRGPGRRLVRRRHPVDLSRGVDRPPGPGRTGPRPHRWRHGRSCVGHVHGRRPGRHRAGDLPAPVGRPPVDPPPRPPHRPGRPGRDELIPEGDEPNARPRAGGVRSGTVVLDEAAAALRVRIGR